jgi:hypothetical protein
VGHLDDNNFEAYRMQYILMIYRDEVAWRALSFAEQNAMEAACLAYEQAQRERGRLITATDLLDEGMPITIRLINNQPMLTDNLSQKPNEHLTCLIFIEARDLNEAIQVAMTLPQARIGAIEVRSLKETRS